MLSALIKTRQKISVLAKGLSMAIQGKRLRNENIMLGKDNYRTQQETQKYLKESPLGKALGVDNLLK
jgi:hypothetical protein